MAIPAGWSATDWAGYLDAQGQPCWITATVTIHDLSGKLLVEVPRKSLLEGQWDIVSGDDAIDRTLRAQFLDIGGNLAPHFDPAVAPKRLIKVRQSIYVDSLGKWLHCYTFTGRPHVTNDGGLGVWSIEAQDKSTFHNRGVPAQQFNKGAYVVTAIRDYLASTGETQFDFPTPVANGTAGKDKRLGGDIKFGGASDQMNPLAAMRRAASLAGLQLFWTGDGVATLRPWPQLSEPLFTFDRELVQSVPEFGTDMSSLRNRWVGGGKGTLRGDVTAEGTYSPAELAINGKPWSNIEWGDDDEAIKSNAEMAQVAKARLNELITLSTTAQFNVVPFWVVDPRDVLAVTTPDRSERFVLRDCSVPIAGLDSGDGTPMSIGTHYNTRGGTAGSPNISRPKKKAKKGKGGKRGGRR